MEIIGNLPHLDLIRAHHSIIDPMASFEDIKITNFYKGIDNVTIHTIEYDIVLTHDIIFDYIKSRKISPVLNLNY